MTLKEAVELAAILREITGAASFAGEQSFSIDDLAAQLADRGVRVTGDAGHTVDAIVGMFATDEADETMLRNAFARTGAGRECSER